MSFRPCIDIHNGYVKQIVGSGLTDEGSGKDNFVSKKGGDYFGELYKKHGLRGGHVILLNKAGTPEYQADLRCARQALQAFPGGLMIGGGVNHENAESFLDMGASHVIVTSAIFKGPAIDMDMADRLSRLVGKDRLTIDISCRMSGGKYYVVTDRWQTFTDFEVTPDNIRDLARFADELLVHGVDVEGKKQGIDRHLLDILSESLEGSFRITYAGGISSMEDIETVDSRGCDYTVGSALSIFGGSLDFDEVVKYNDRSLRKGKEGS